MPPAPNNLPRLLSLLPALANRDGQAVERVCAELELSRKELEGYLQLLSAVRYADWTAGDLIDIWIEDERLQVHIGSLPGGIVRFTAEEQLALRLGHDLLHARGESVDHGRVQELLGRMSAGDELASESARRLQASIAVSPQPSVDEALPALIGEALKEGVCLELVYYSRGRDTTSMRMVEPWELYHDRQFSYLHAWDRGSKGVRTFRLDRVIHARKLSDGVTQTPCPIPESHSAGEAAPRACVILRGFLRRLAHEESWADREELEGGTRWRPKLENPGWLLNLLLPWAHECELVEPADLRAQLLTRLEKRRRVLFADAIHGDTTSGESDDA